MRKASRDSEEQGILSLCSKTLMLDPPYTLPPAIFFLYGGFLPSKIHCSSRHNFLIEEDPTTMTGWMAFEMTVDYLRLMTEEAGDEDDGFVGALLTLTAFPRHPSAEDRASKLLEKEDQSD
ncbi:hypothetical protein ACLOJK_026680 [Asimina triloba]